MSVPKSGKHLESQAVMPISPRVGPENAAITAPMPGDPLRQRVAIEAVRPQLDGGRFAIKRTVGETVQVTAHVFGDGHDRLAAVVKHRHTSDAASNTAPGAWLEVPLTPRGNDEWTASFEVTKLGIHEYTVEAWVDRFGSWLAELVAKSDAGVDVASELLEGAALIELAARVKDAAREDDDVWLLERANQLKSVQPQRDRVALARDPALARSMAARPDRSSATVFAPTLRIVVDPVRARFGAWYEFFPRSCTPDPARAGTLRDAEARLPALADMGFDVVYLPPIHPIGLTNRKGRNNTLVAAADDPGSPWAIGSPAGGHTAVDPALGTIDDFDRFVGVANRLGMEVALDIAFQASPDHPWVQEHPTWFKQRPDGSIKFAENPPKKYQDIYPLDLGSRDRQSLWVALRDVFLFWLSHGVRTFRVDNPHTKPFRFWEWCIADITRDHPDVIFLAEAFTRPKVMQHLAKLGFNQSYTYFTWRNTAAELREYLTELTATDVREYMRPNFFANTPDILHEYLQRGGRPAFEVRLILAATLSASYGIYSGFELCEHLPVRPGSEEYLDSEKYQIKVRDWHAPGNLTELIARVNAIRHEQTALQQNTTLRFHNTDNPAFLWFSKQADGAAPVFVVANTDPAWMQHGWVEMPLDLAGLTADTTYEVEDLLDGARYTWHGARNYVRLAPAERVAHIFAVRR
jgi:starch synthase (maltosyl-transferring)